MNEYTDIFAKRSNKGQESYYDLMTILPEPLKYEPKMMLAAQLMQDYLNGGYRKLPSPDYQYPLNHSHDDLFYTYAERLGLEYVKDRDIGTWAIPDNLIAEYKSIYSGESRSFRPDVAWPDKSIYYDYVDYLDDYISNNGIVVENRFSYYTLKPWSKASMLDFNSTYEEFRFLWPLVQGSNSKLDATFYVRKDEIISIFSGYSGDISLNGSYNGTTASIPSAAYADFNRVTLSGNNGADIYSSIISNSTEDFMKYVFSGSDAGKPASNCHITVYGNPSEAAPNMPIIVPEIIKIYEWQDPKNFYNHFSGKYQDPSYKDLHIDRIIDPSVDSKLRFDYIDGAVVYKKMETMYNGHDSYRHESDGRSLREKIARLAFVHDPEIIDFEYIQLVAAQMGYDIDISVEDIQDSYYSTSTEDKDNMVRTLISNMPYYNRIKTTNNSLELIFLSIGIVAQVINMYTYGKYDGFSDSNIIENAYEISKEGNGWNKTKYNRALKMAPLREWFPSPHFYIKVDLSSGYLGQNDTGSSLSNMIYKMMKIVKTNKPENTVFRGFSIMQKILNLNRIYVAGTSTRQSIRYKTVCKAAHP